LEIKDERVFSFHFQLKIRVGWISCFIFWFIKKKSLLGFTGHPDSLSYFRSLSTDLPCHHSITPVSSTVSPQNNGGVFLVSLYLFVCLYLEIHHTKLSYISIAIYSFHLNHRPATRNEI
jgi:hypothetical protein